MDGVKREGWYSGIGFYEGTWRVTQTADDAVEMPTLTLLFFFLFSFLPPQAFLFVLECFFFFFPGWEAKPGGRADVAFWQQSDRYV